MAKMRTTIQISTTSDFQDGSIIKDDVIEEDDSVLETKIDQMMEEVYHGKPLYARSRRVHDITPESKWSETRYFRIRRPWGVFRNNTNFMDENSWQACDLNGNIVDKSINRNHSYYKNITDYLEETILDNGKIDYNWFVKFPPLWIKSLPFGIPNSDCAGKETFLLSDYQHDNTFKLHPVFLYLDYNNTSLGTNGLLISKYNGSPVDVPKRATSTKEGIPDEFVVEPKFQVPDTTWFYNNAQGPVTNLNYILKDKTLHNAFIPFERWHLAFLQLLLLAKYCHYDPQGEYIKDNPDKPYDLFGLVDINKPGEHLFVDGTWCTGNYILTRPNRVFSKYGHSFTSTGSMSTYYRWVTLLYSSIYRLEYPGGNYYWPGNINGELPVYSPNYTKSVLSSNYFNTINLFFNNSENVKQYNLMESFLWPQPEHKQLIVSNRPNSLFLYQVSAQAYSTTSCADSQWFFTNWPIEFNDNNGVRIKIPGGIFSTSILPQMHYTQKFSSSYYQQETTGLRYRFCKTLHILP